MRQTYTGNILIAVNPFIKLPHLYNNHMMEQYRGAPLGELSPHVFAVADASYRCTFHTYTFIFIDCGFRGALDLFYVLLQ